MGQRVAVAPHYYCGIGKLGFNLLTRVLDVFLMVLLALLPARPDRAAATMLCVVHVFRSAVANCARPLLRTALMDVLRPGEK